MRKNFAVVILCPTAPSFHNPVGCWGSVCIWPSVLPVPDHFFARCHFGYIHREFPDRHCCIAPNCFPVMPPCSPRKSQTRKVPSFLSVTRKSSLPPVLS